MYNSGPVSIHGAKHYCSSMGILIVPVLILRYANIVSILAQFGNVSWEHAVGSGEIPNPDRASSFMKIVHSAYQQYRFKGPHTNVGQLLPVVHTPTSGYNTPSGGIPLRCNRVMKCPNTTI